MKKSLLILAAASAIGFAACNGGNNEGSLTPAQLDSVQQATRKATEDSIANAQKLQSDSLANAQNAKAVDSLKRINDSLSTVASKPAPATPSKKPTKPAKNNNGGTTTPVRVPEPEPEPTKTKQQTKFDQRNNTNDRGISEEKKAEQKSKFDRRNNN